MWSFIKSTCELHLSRYGSTAEEDQALLDKNDTEQTLVGNEETCIIFRLGEKKCLKMWADMAEFFMKMLKMNDKEARKFYNSNNFIRENTSFYA